MVTICAGQKQFIGCQAIIVGRVGSQVKVKVLRRKRDTFITCNLSSLTTTKRQLAEVQHNPAKFNAVAHAERTPEVFVSAIPVENENIECVKVGTGEGSAPAEKTKLKIVKCAPCRSAPGWIVLRLNSLTNVYFQLGGRKMRVASAYGESIEYNSRLEFARNCVRGEKRGFGKLVFAGIAKVEKQFAGQ